MIIALAINIQAEVTIIALPPVRNTTYEYVFSFPWSTHYINLMTVSSCVNFYLQTLSQKYILCQLLKHTMLLATLQINLL